MSQVPEITGVMAPLNVTPVSACHYHGTIHGLDFEGVCCVSMVQV